MVRYILYKAEISFKFFNYKILFKINDKLTSTQEKCLISLKIHELINHLFVFYYLYYFIGFYVLYLLTQLQVVRTYYL
jgi:hypothetical protein